MAHIVILGAGIGGMPCAYGIREMLPIGHRVTVINERDDFQFVPSNPWIAVGWRDRESVTFELRPHLEPKGIGFIGQRCERIDARRNRLELEGGRQIEYDYLIIATGPRPAFEEVVGSDPELGHLHSLCTADHAQQAYTAYNHLLQKPGRVIIGAMAGASCLGPVYELAFIMDADLRRRKMRDRVPITFVTPEPYAGALGLGGVGDSRECLESALRSRQIDWICNAKVTGVGPGRMAVEEYASADRPGRVHALEFNYSVMLPAFSGVAAVVSVAGLCDARGCVLVDKHQRSPNYPNIYSAGVGIAVPAVEETPVPTGAPITGYMIEAMVTAIVHNIADQIAGRPLSRKVVWNAICLADMGEGGAAFVALPQFPPRHVAWCKQGKWVHMAKIAFEKYSLRKLKRGTSEAIYERYILKMLGIEN
ncbi:MAG: NAD(P)/FAD-dependent oxidoreductase [Gammaproteobacteria bacterium]|nr:NAD(P)/FAD-dependent oxidoreductase [Gammaproteobacteria bacterium]